MTDEQSDAESGPMVDAVNAHVLDHLVNGPAAHRALMDAAITADRRADTAEAQAKLWQEAVAVVRAEADALTKAYAEAEAQRDRLAAALTRLHDAIDDFNAGSEKDDDERQHLCWLCGASTYGGDGVIHEPHCAIVATRAALADVPEEGRPSERVIGN